MAASIFVLDRQGVTMCPCTLVKPMQGTSSLWGSTFLSHVVPGRAVCHLNLCSPDSVEVQQDMAVAQE